MKDKKEDMGLKLLKVKKQKAKKLKINQAKLFGKKKKKRAKYKNPFDAPVSPDFLDKHRSKPGDDSFGVL